MVPTVGTDPSPELEDLLRAAIAEKFAKAQVPHKIFFLDRLPRTANGKVQRFALSDAVQDHLNVELAR